MMLKVLDVDGAVRRVQGGWESTGQPWSYDADRYCRVAQARRAEQQAMLRLPGTSERCRMRFLREQLDDPQAGGVPTAVAATTAPDRRCPRTSTLRPCQAAQNCSMSRESWCRRGRCGRLA